MSLPSSPRRTRSTAGPRTVTRWVFLGLVGFFLSVGTALAGPLPEGLLAIFDFSEDGGSQKKLSRRLEEISGLATASQGRIFAHNDERAVFYELDPSSGEILKAFSAGIGGIPGDFEGIAIAGERFFLMTSAGDLVETSEGEDGSAREYRVHRTRLSSLCEFEGLAFHPERGTLLLPCKRTKADSFDDHLVVLEVELDPIRTYPVPRVFIPFQDLEALGLKDRFHPSAIEIHQETDRILMVSARQESIIELSGEGVPLGGEELKKKVHPQPEGITFLSDGSLLLADEGQGKRGRITLYEPRSREEGIRP